MPFRSHIGQDLWVDTVFGQHRGGFFLDFGAFDGITISNTFFLERQRGWTGICVEPNPTFYPCLCAVRNCITVNAALWPQSRQTLRLLDAHGLSSLSQFADADDNATRRRKATVREVEVDTVNPTELLRRFDAPRTIHYLSLDVEGAELEVLSGLDLTTYQVALMTVEHNHNTDLQDKVMSYLTPFGYRAVTVRNEDWFWHLDALAALTGKRPSSDQPGDVATKLAEAYGVRD